MNTNDFIARLHNTGDSGEYSAIEFDRSRATIEFDWPRATVFGKAVESNSLRESSRSKRRSINIYLRLYEEVSEGIRTTDAVRRYRDYFRDLPLPLRPFFAFPPRVARLTGSGGGVEGTGEREPVECCGETRGSST